jgi:multimeric flavodoxin WrbA
MKVSPINVLVIFYSCCGKTEKLALAAAVGAVQARANIRMRRLNDAGEHIAECSEDLARMRKEYVPPTQTDTVWADAVIIGLHDTVAGQVTSTAEATAYGRRVTSDTRTFKEKNFTL